MDHFLIIHNYRSKAGKQQSPKNRPALLKVYLFIFSIFSGPMKNTTYMFSSSNSISLWWKTNTKESKKWSFACLLRKLEHVLQNRLKPTIKKWLRNTKASKGSLRLLDMASKTMRFTIKSQTLTIKTLLILSIFEKSRFLRAIMSRLLRSTLEITRSLLTSFSTISSRTIVARSTMGTKSLI